MSASIGCDRDLVGAGYLCYLGVQAIRHRRALAGAFGAQAVQHGTLRSAWDGFVVGVANPKVLILFAAVLPQLVDRAAGHVTAQMLLLGLVSFAIAVVSDSGWANVASTVRSWFVRSPRRLELVGGAGGLAMIGVGITVAATGRRD